VSPIPSYGGSLATPAVDRFGEVFVAPVYPGSAVKILNSDFTSAGTVLNSSSGYMRCIAVSPDGNDVYAPSFNPAKFYLYHSDNGSLGPYVLKDTILSQLVVESVAWHPGTGDLWVSSGNVTSGLPTAPYSPYRWYAYSLSAKRIVDSIVWKGPVDIDPRPRGIAFSPTGDTAYVAAFTLAWYLDPCVEMFVKTPTQLSSPNAPTLASPRDTATGVSTSPTFRWNTSDRATSYRLQVTNSANFGGIFYVNQGGIADTFYTASGLSKNTTYYWRVNAANVRGTSPYSTTWSFSTVKGPKLGDVDNGGEVSAADASLILRHIAGISILVGDALQAADVSGDGTVSAYDAALVLQFAAGLIAKFPGDH